MNPNLKPETSTDTMPTEPAPFDLESVYDEQIAPLMTNIIEICKTNKMPMMAAFMYQHRHGEQEVESYCTTSLPGEGDWKPEKIIRATEIIRRAPHFAAFTITG